MTRRYGRNQKRAAREALAAATQQVTQWRREAERANSSLAYAREAGASEVLKRQHLAPAIDALMRRLAQNLTPELAREAQRILDASASQHRRPFPLDMYASFDPADVTIMRIDVRVPEMRCGIAVTNW